jgi:outer membrane murein-binding lipoprotein Lpp
MTGRDRIVLMVIAVVVILAGGWLKLVSPERAKANKLATQVATANSALASAEGKLASARASQSQYPAAYAAMVNLGKAVPPSQEVPSLMYQLSLATADKQVEFTSIATSAVGGGSGSSTVTAPSAASSKSSTPSSSSATSGSATSASASSATASATGSPSASGASTSAAAFTQMPFTFVFEGSYFDLERLLRELTSFTTRSSSGTLEVNGRLLTVQSVKLVPTDTSHAGAGTLSGTITATAYTAPASAAPVAASSATPPVGSATSAASTTASGTSANAPAVVRVTP